MDDRLDNCDLPSSWMVPFEPPSRKGKKSFASSKSISAPQAVELDIEHGNLEPQPFL